MTPADRTRRGEINTRMHELRQTGDGRDYSDGYLDGFSGRPSVMQFRLFKDAYKLGYDHGQEEWAKVEESGGVHG